MKPKLWRISKKLTFKGLSKLMGGISPGYLCQIESGKRKPSGRVLTGYHKLSKGRVSPADFKLKKRKPR